MSKIDLIARFNIIPEKKDAFIAIAAKCMEAVRSGGEGTLKYDWYMSGNTCVVLETYENNEAVLHHMALVGDLLGQLLETSQISGEIYGTPGSEIKEMLAPFEVNYFEPLQVLV